MLYVIAFNLMPGKSHFGGEEDYLPEPFFKLCPMPRQRSRAGNLLIARILKCEFNFMFEAD